MSDKIRKYVLPNLPYLFVFWFFSKIGTAYRIAPGTDFGTKLMGMLDTFPKAFETYWPGLGGIDLLVGLAGAAGMYLLIQSKIRQAKKFRRDAEYGSARWGNEKDIKPFIDLLIDDTLYLRNLFFCHRRKVGKVKTKFILIYQRTRLLHMTSKNHSQRFLHKMGGAVVICRQISPALLHFQRHIFPSTKGTRYHLSHMSDLCPLQFDSILYKKPAMFCRDHAGICCLSTHRSIKGRLLHQHRSFHSL